jgi:hypothetical protein
MKTLFLLFAYGAISFNGLAQGSPDKHLLDDSWVRYTYETHGEVRLEFFDGKVMWKWLDPNSEEATRDAKLSDNEKVDAIAYRSENVGDHIYVINWFHEPSGTYVTLTFNFKEKMMCGSAILGPKTENLSILFDKGIIKEYHLAEH